MMGPVLGEARRTVAEKGGQQQPDEAHAFNPIPAGPAFNRGYNPS